MTRSAKIRNILKALGPGILFASTAIGVSHLVQSTRAGAVYGYGLIWAVILANLFKYPFFEYGSRYANATGESIIDGYKRLSKWALWLYFLITIGSMFFVVAAIGVVTSGFLDNLFGIGNVRLVTILIFSLSAIILILGKYKVLDSLIKVIASVLLLSTLLAFVLTLFHGPQGNASLMPSIDYGSDATFLFLFALMGWMPTAVDLSTWNSLWTLERIKQTRYHPPLKETLFDFNFGYLVSALFIGLLCNSWSIRYVRDRNRCSLSKCSFRKLCDPIVHCRHWRLELFYHCGSGIFDNVWNLYSCIRWLCSLG